jgi:hypothetical protein
MNEDQNFAHQLNFEATTYVLLSQIEAIKLALRYAMEEPRKPDIHAGTIIAKIDALADGFICEVLVNMEKDNPAEAARLSGAITTIRGTKLWDQ